MHMRIMERGEELKKGGLNMVTIYNTKKSRKLAEKIKKITETWGKERVMIGEDFNIRIENLGGDAEEGGIEKRRKDKKIGNGEGRIYGADEGV